MTEKLQKTRKMHCEGWYFTVLYTFTHYDYVKFKHRKKQQTSVFYGRTGFKLSKNYTFL